MFGPAQKSLQQLEFKLLTTAYFPRTKLWPFQRPWSRFFFRNAHLQRRFDGRDERQNLTRCVGFLVGSKIGLPSIWRPQGRSPCCKLASLPYKLRVAKRIEVFFVKMPTEYWLIMFHWHSASWSLCFGCICFFLCFFPFNDQDLCSTSGRCDCRLPKYTMMCHHVSI